MISLPLCQPQYPCRLAGIVNRRGFWAIGNGRRDGGWKPDRGALGSVDVRCWTLDVPSKNNKSLPDLAVKQGQIGGWESATLSFPCRH